jgi:hypothetical protein
MLTVTVGVVVIVVVLADAALVTTDVDVVRLFVVDGTMSKQRQAVDKAAPAP